MGRAIDQDNRLDRHEHRLGKHDHRIKLLEDALEEMVHTWVHHVDLHDTDKEEFTPPVGKRKRTTKVEKSNAEA